MPYTENGDPTTQDSSHCKIDETLTGKPCSFPGEAFYGGAFVCLPHARLLGAEDRTVLLWGIVSTLDLCLQSLSFRRDSEILETLRFDRAEAFQELAQARKDLQLAENELPV